MKYCQNVFLFVISFNSFIDLASVRTHFFPRIVCPPPLSTLDLNSGLTAALGLNLDDTDHPIVI
jgi:hypothetical protein